jgi:hypothetical protein
MPDSLNVLAKGEVGELRTSIDAGLALVSNGVLQ